MATFEEEEVVVEEVVEQEEVEFLWWPLITTRPEVEIVFDRVELPFRWWLAVDLLSFVAESDDITTPDVVVDVFEDDSQSSLESLVCSLIWSISEADRRWWLFELSGLSFFFFYHCHVVIVWTDRQTMNIIDIIMDRQKDIEKMWMMCYELDIDEKINDRRKKLSKMKMMKKKSMLERKKMRKKREKQRRR